MGIFGEVAGIDYPSDLYEKAQERTEKMMEGKTTSEKLRMYGDSVDITDIINNGTDTK